MANYLKIGQHFARGSHHFPRFIYHMTNKANYEAIVRSGSIEPRMVEYMGKGICATDLCNLFKRWGKNEICGNLHQQLISQAAKGTGEIVILRIPTGKLNTDALRIRSQQRLFSFMKSSEAEEAMRKACADFKNIDKKKSNWVEEYINILKRHLPSSSHHIVEGAPAKQAKLFKQRKEAIEYFYPFHIKTEDFEKIGEVNLRSLGEQPSIKEVFSNLLKGTPECKAAELLTC